MGDLGVYASKSLKHMMTGHAYSRALRARLPFLVSSIIQELNLSDDYIGKIRLIHNMLQNAECNPHDATQISREVLNSGFSK